MWIVPKKSLAPFVRCFVNRVAELVTCVESVASAVSRWLWPRRREQQTEQQRYEVGYTRIRRGDATCGRLRWPVAYLVVVDDRRQRWRSIAAAEAISSHQRPIDTHHPRYNTHPVTFNYSLPSTAISRLVCQLVKELKANTPEDRSQCGILQGAPKKWGLDLIAVIRSKLNRISIFSNPRYLAKFALKSLLKLPSHLA